MTTSDFDKIEQELALTLPAFYKTVMTDYPFTAQDEFDFIEDNLVKNPQWLIEKNRELRAEGFLDQNWAPQFYAVGYDGCGNYYFIDVNSDESTIYYAQTDESFDADDIENLELHATIEEFIEECIELQKELLED